MDGRKVREDTHKKRFFFSGRTTKGVGGGNFFSINGENTPGSCIMKILFYEVQHFSPNFHEFTGSKQYLPKKTFLAQKREKKKFVRIRFRLL